MLFRPWILKLVRGMLGLLLGLILLTVDGGSILAIVCKIVGVIMLIGNVPRVLTAALSGTRAPLARIDLISSIIGMSIGCIMLFLPAIAQMIGIIIAGAWFLVLPVMDIISSPYRSEQFKQELPKLVLGVVIMVVGPVAMFGIVLKIIGGILAVASVFLIGNVIWEIARNGGSR